MDIKHFRYQYFLVCRHFLAKNIYHLRGLSDKYLALPQSIIFDEGVLESKITFVCFFSLFTDIIG